MRCLRSAAEIFEGETAEWAYDPARRDGAYGSDVWIARRCRLPGLHCRGSALAVFARAFKMPPIRPFPEGVRLENHLGNFRRNLEEKRNVRRCPGGAIRLP